MMNTARTARHVTRGEYLSKGQRHSDRDSADEPVDSSPTRSSSILKASG
jgi:hypothetical protein